MPNYKRKYYKKKTPANKKTITKIVKRVIANQEELKLRDLANATSTAIPKTGLILAPVDAIPAGTGSSERVGQVITVKSMEFKAVLNANASAVNSAVRVMMILDKQPDGESPVIADLLAGTNIMLAPIKSGSQLRYRVLSDRLFSFDVDDVNRVNKIYRKLNTKIMWESGDAQPITNNIFVLLIGNQDEATEPVTDYWIRTRYSDA